MRKRTELENGESANEESIDSLDKQLAESKFTLAASESKFDDISRKLATLEADATRGNERAEVFFMKELKENLRNIETRKSSCQVAEKKIMDIEEELKIVGANMQTLEMSEEKTMKREEGLQEEILELR